jgi:hypothetical protein
MHISGVLPVVVAILAGLISGCADLPGTLFHVKLTEAPAESACSELAGVLSASLNLKVHASDFISLPRSNLRQCHIILQPGSTTSRVEVEILSDPPSRVLAVRIDERRHGEWASLSNSSRELASDVHSILQSRYGEAMVTVKHPTQGFAP